MLRYRGMQLDRWDHTCTLQATIYAIASGKQVSPSRLHPYRSETVYRPPVTKREAKQTSKELRAMLAERAKR